jgi:hypothetical protein
MASSGMLAATHRRNTPPSNNPRRDPTNSLPSLGQSTSNFSGRQRSLKFFNGFADLLHFPRFEATTLATVEGDGMETLFHTFFTGCASQPIPHNFNDKLMPEDPSDKRRLMISGITQNCSLVGTQFREKFRDHPSFPTKLGDPHSEWF